MKIMDILGVSEVRWSQNGDFTCYKIAAIPKNDAITWSHFKFNRIDRIGAKYLDKREYLDIDTDIRKMHLQSILKYPITLFLTSLRDNKHKLLLNMIPF